MFEPQNDGRARSRGRSLTLASPRRDDAWRVATAAEPGLAFIGMVRTRSTNIIGFSEMLMDENLDLAAEQRAEYLDIVCAETRALDRDVRRFLAAPSAPQ